MEKDFWLDIWETNTIGFHQYDYNQFLKEHFPEWKGDQESSIFVPLCGKSKDMLFLREFGDVIGSELIDIACQDFFKENDVEHEVTTLESGYKHYKADKLDILQGDFFGLPEHHLADCQLIYDRAAIIALPVEMRKRYVERLREVFPKGTRLFLVTLEYPGDAMDGPPHNVSEQEVNELFAGCDIQRIATIDITGKKFARLRFDLEWIYEGLYFITF